MFKQITFMVVVVLFAARAPLAFAEGKPGNDEAAKQLFYKMEDRLSRATSLNCNLQIKLEGTGEPGGPLMKRNLTGSLAVADGKRVRIELKQSGEKSDKPGEIYWLSVSDGNRQLHQDTGTPKPLVGNAGKDDPLADFSTLLARSGLALVTFPLPPVEARDMKDRFPVSEFKLGPKEKVGDVTAQRLDYRFDVKGQKQPNGDDAPFRASVWIDPMTSLPLKRSITWKLVGVQVMSIDERYENLVIDEKLDAGTFKVPQQ